jgi:hypothetical protein
MSGRPAQAPAELTTDECPASITNGYEQRFWNLRGDSTKRWLYGEEKRRVLARMQGT